MFYSVCHCFGLYLVVYIILLFFCSIVLLLLLLLLLLLTPYSPANLRLPSSSIYENLSIISCGASSSGLLEVPLPKPLCTACWAKYRNIGYKDNHWLRDSVTQHISDSHWLKASLNSDVVKRALYHWTSWWIVEKGDNSVCWMHTKSMTKRVRKIGLSAKKSDFKKRLRRLLLKSSEPNCSTINRHQRGGWGNVKATAKRFDYYVRMMNHKWSFGSKGGGVKVERWQLRRNWIFSGILTATVCSRNCDWNSFDCDWPKSPK